MNMSLSSLQYCGELDYIVFGSNDEGGGQGGLLVLNVAQSEPTGEPA